MTRMRKIIGAGLAAFASLVLFTGSASAHDLSGAGQPVCLEGNFMVADATGMGRVVEMNTMTGEIGIIVDPPFVPWKPTGVLSGGVNGHAFISSAAQHRISEFHRDGTLIRTITPITAPPQGPPFGQMPRLLGSQFMPNGNIIQAVCDANFNDSTVWPPVSSTYERAQNSRLLVFDQGTLSEVDEYNAPDDPRWTCMAGIIFSEEGMYVSMFHGAAVFVIDWKAGVDNNSSGFGSNNTDFDLVLGDSSNQAQVIRVIDMYPGAAMDDPRRRDSLRAITLDADGNLYATNRARAVEGVAGLGNARQHIAVVPWGAEGPAGTIAMDHGVQIIAGIRTNRVSGPGCKVVRRGDPKNKCDFETLYVASTGTGTVLEYLIGEENWDEPTCRDDNTGCAQPIAEFFSGELDPRMLMTIHEAFVQ